MLLFTIKRRSRIATALVVMQFVHLFVLAYHAAEKVWRWDVPMGAVLSVAVALLLAVWALVHNPPGNFNISPVQRNGGELIITGPYRWVRHPMYTSVLLGSATLAWLSESLIGWTAWSALAVVLLVKSTLTVRAFY